MKTAEKCIAGTGLVLLLLLTSAVGAPPPSAGERSSSVSGRSPTVADRPTCAPGANVPTNRVNTTERLQQLRTLMTNYNVDAYIVTTDSPHLDEEYEAYDQRREFISGFSGSAGTAVITAAAAALWTDGRYFLQAEQQLDCNWILMKQSENGVPTITEWLKEVLTTTQTAAADPLLVSSGNWIEWQQQLNPVAFNPLSTNLIDLIWTVDNGRPPPVTTPVVVYPIEYAGVTWQDKLVSARNELSKLGADSLIVSGLDEVAWLYNIRGPEVPTVKSFALVTSSQAYWFVDETRVTPEVQQHLNTQQCNSQPCVRIHPYSNFSSMLPSLISTSPKVLVPSQVSYSGGSSYAVYNTVPAEKRVVAHSPLVYMKARKNSVEVAGMKRAHLRDAVALCDFLSLLEEEVPTGVYWDELKVGSVLEEFRRQQVDSRGPSFGTIAGFGPNGAVIHYSATPETNLRINTSSLLLIDSGGYYLDGTTDVTRTLHYGEPTAEQRDAYTRVLMGAIDLAMLVFTRKTPDTRIDIITRKYLHEVGLDYLHGTGHGIGAYLGVHESPTQVRVYSNQDHVFEENYFFSDEPGYYKENKYGIRLETILRVIPKTFPTEFSDRFFAFEAITLVPFEPKLIAIDLMTSGQLKWLNEYHKQVLEVVGPELQQQGRQRAYNWLVSKTWCLGPGCP